MIRIVIAEDQKLLLGVMSSLLNLEDDMEVVGQARNGEEALTLVYELQPDVCIMDIEMPKMSGLDAAEALMPTRCKILMLTTFFRTGYVERAIKADVKGYLLKDGPSEELVCSIRKVMDGKHIYSPELMDHYEPGLEEVEKHTTRNETVNHIRKVRNYISTILDKMKLSVG